VVEEGQAETAFYRSAVETVVHIALTLPPSVVTLVMMAMLMPAAISAYSIEVAPLSSLMKFLILARIEDFLSFISKQRHQVRY
jgi:hypothetical protein